MVRPSLDLKVVVGHSYHKCFYQLGWEARLPTASAPMSTPFCACSACPDSCLAQFLKAHYRQISAISFSSSEHGPLKFS